MSRLVLASASPRRQELLQGIGIDFIVSPANVNEDILPGEEPESVVLRLSKAKADEVANQFQNETVLAADTIVVLSEQSRATILGKPQDENDAIAMLTRLQGRAHRVFTGFCLVNRSTKSEVLRSVMSEVHFGELSPAEIAAYVATGEGLDKAGSYALQGRGGWFVKEIRGSYSNVIGLPLWEVLSELKQLGIWSAQNITSQKI